MQFKPEKQLIFNYTSGKHLPTNLLIKNNSEHLSYFKFKVSKTNKFVVKPNVGNIRPGEEILVQIIIHKDIVSTASSQKIQIVYGRSYEQTKSFELLVENGSKTDRLNLTMMINQKEQRVTKLEKEVQNYLSMPTKSGSFEKKKGLNKIHLILAIMIGLIVGYFLPISIFNF